MRLSLKSLLAIIVLSFFLAACGRKEQTAPEKKRFKKEVLLKTTPVKNQGASSLCWVYAMLATIETEHLMQGDSVNLSADYVGRAFLKEQANEIMMTGKGEISTRGIGSMLLRLIQRYGITHYDAYHRKDNCSYNILGRKLQKMAMANANDLKDRQQQIDEALDEAIGPVPRYVFMLGAEYTALEFAHSVCRENEYDALTSFSHHPFNVSFPLEIPDNRYHDTFLNVPLDTLMRRVETSLRQGHPVCWEGDISEPGFLWKQGIATLSDEDKNITQDVRQEAFEHRNTTDDHCMEIIGIARDHDGKKFFVMKNSWGRNNAYGGIMFMSENYMRLKTIAVFLPK